jgi:uncharacterized membrane protein YkvA (DUF1232 family)
MADRDIDRELEELRREREAAGLAFEAEAWPDEEALEEESAPAVAGGAGLPSTGLLSFYDRLRARIVARVERRGGLGAAAVKALLLVPDVFILLARLLLDPEVPGSARAVVGGALAYFVLPLDLMPEALLGAGGYLDDLVLATAVLAHAFTGELEPFARKHWSGTDELRVVLADVAGAAQGLLGADLYGRLRRVLARRGVEIEEGEEPAEPGPSVH